MSGEFPAPNAGPGGPIDFPALLNQAQHEAVTAPDGPVLVVAGAGSGKTRTLVFRVAWLVEQGVPPEAILLLTFTRKAAAEMLFRAGRLVGDACTRVSGGTFHSLAHELLREFAPRLGYPFSFGILDRGDMEEVLGQLRKASGLGEGDKRFPKRSTLATIISKAANKSEDLEVLLNREYVHLLGYLKPVLALSKEYIRFKQENAVLDFDDLLILLERLLATDPEAADAIRARYRYILVDEYQDTNPIQAEIVRHLSAGHHNIMVVGDDAQSIYSFRGASFENMMSFPKVYPDVRVIRLEENYRSRQPILDLTNSMIAQASRRFEKRLVARRTGGDKPQVVTVANQMEQSLFVCRRIRELLDEGVPLERMAVLFRAARHSFKLEVELARNGLDFVKVGGRRFIEAAHIKDLLSLLRAVANPTDTVSLTRCLLLLEGVGPRTAGRLVSWIDGRRDNLMAMDKRPPGEKLTGLAALFREIAPKGTPLQERVEKAWAFYRPIMEARFDDHPSRLMDVMEFLTISRNYTNLTKFLADMALEPPNASSPESTGKLVLSTVHSAKGLEWKVVFIIWATEGRFPATYALNSQDDLDEERRLMYVASTRAEDMLYLVAPQEEEYSGAGMTRPSRFLSDLPSNLYTSTGAPRATFATATSRIPVPTPKKEPARTMLRPATSSAGDLKPGDRVSHPVFGLGRVVSHPENRKIRIDFDHFGAKTLHLDFAGLTLAG